MGSYVFDLNSRKDYVLVQFGNGTKTYWSGSDFQEDPQQAKRYQNYAQAAQALHKLDKKLVKSRIVPMPIDALEQE